MRSGLILAVLAIVPTLALSQAQVPLGGMRGDPTKPVEITSDALDVSQNDNTAVFTGNVVVVQGDLKLTAPSVRVLYTDPSAGPRKIARVNATGGVTLVSPTEAAEGQEAVYTPDNGAVVMTGNVTLTQGPNVITGDRLNVDLNTGTGKMEGRVKTVLKQDGN